MNLSTVLENIFAECNISITPIQLATFIGKIENNPITATNPNSLVTATRMIRSRRESLGVSQVEIGKLIGVSDTTIRSYEANGYLKTSVADVATILSYLNKKEAMLIAKQVIKH